MPTPLTNFFPGISLAATGMGLYMPVFNPLDHVVFFDDFYKYTAGDWTLTETQAGATQALTSGHGGRLLLTNSAADNDLVSLQHGTTSFVMSSGRKFWMQMRFQCSEATESDLFLGLSAIDASPIASAPSDFIAFTKDDGSTALNFKTQGSSAAIQSIASIGTLAAATDITLGMHYDGGSGLLVFANNNNTGSATAAFASLLPTAALAPTIALQNGDGNARTLNVDYLLFAAER